MTNILTLDNYLSLPLTDLNVPMYITSFRKETTSKFIFYYHNGCKIIDNIDSQSGDLGPIIFGSKNKCYRPVVNMRLLYELDKLYNLFVERNKLVDEDHPIILSFIDNKIDYKNVDMYLAEKYIIKNRFTYEILPECDFSKPVKVTEISFKTYSGVTDLWFNKAGLSFNTHPSLIYLAVIEANDMLMRIKCEQKIIEDFYEIVNELFSCKKKKVNRNNPIYVYYMKKRLLYSKKLKV